MILEQIQDSEMQRTKVEYSKGRPGEEGKFYSFLQWDCFVSMLTEEFLSAPGNGGWEVVLDKACILATLF